MAQAKTASKNNPGARAKAKEIFYNGHKVRPLKFISEKKSYLSAEYEENNQIVVDDDGMPLPWSTIKAST